MHKQTYAHLYRLSLFSSSTFHAENTELLEVIFYLKTEFRMNEQNGNCTFR